MGSVDRISLGGEAINSTAKSLVGIGGHLECMECGHLQPLNEAAMAERLTNGWPKHCGYTMRWITARQEQGNDLQPSDPDTSTETSEAQE